MNTALFASKVRNEIVKGPDPKDAHLSMPEVSGVVESVDTTNLARLIEMVQKRESAFVVVPEKGTILMTRDRDNQDNFKLQINGIDGSRSDFTIDSKGKIIKVGTTDVRELSPIKQLELDRLNEYLKDMPAEQVQLNPIPVGKLTDLKPDNNDRLAMMLENGRIDKTQLIRDYWAASGGKPSQLPESVDEMKNLDPYSLTSDLFDSVRKDLLAEVANVNSDPEMMVRLSRSEFREAFKNSDPALSAKMTKLYQKETGDVSVNVMVSSDPTVDAGLALQLGDGNIAFSKKLYDTIIRNCPNPDDQEQVILDILLHEHEHYVSGDNSTRGILTAVQAEYNKKLNQNSESGTITKGEAFARSTAAELLLLAAIREQEKEADGHDGLHPETVRVLKIFREEKKAIEELAEKMLGEEHSVVDSTNGSIWLPHPPLSER